MHGKKVNTLTIKTPEGVEFSLLLAGPISRFLACTIDFFAKMTLFTVSKVVMSIFFIISPDFAFAFLMISYFVISIGYSITLEWYWSGQTLGKRLLQLRVMDVQGLRIHFSQIVIRNLLRTVDQIPLCYMVGGLSSLINRKAQRLGDLAANTIVVRHPRISEPDLNQLIKDKYNSLRHYPHLCARLRHNVTPREADLAMQALMRRDEFAPHSRIELFSEMAYYFKKMVRFPPEIIDGTPDEQYIRNVVDILFRDGRPARIS